MVDKHHYIEEILERRPDLSEAILTNYLDALESFLTSQRYLVMKPLQLQRFLGDVLDSNHSLASITLGELADYDLTELCLVHSMNSQALDSLGRFLANLGQQSSGVVEGEVFMDPVHSVPLGAEEMPIPSDWKAPEYRVHEHTAAQHFKSSELSSVEEERLLREALDEVRGKSDYPSISVKLVGDFWSDEYGKSPFVTMLTWGQLLGMNLPDLMHKHYYTVRVSLGIIAAAKAVSRAYEDKQPSQTGRQINPLQEQAKLETKEKASVPIHVAPVDGYPDIVALSLAPVLQFIEKVSGTGNAMQEELARALGLVSDEILLSSLLLGDLSGHVLVNEGSPKNSKVALLNEFNRVLSERAPKSVSLIKSVLAAPAAREELLVQALFADECSALVPHVLTRALCKALGAERPSWLGSTLPTYWTLVPETFTMVIEKLISTAPCSLTTMSARSQRLLPDVLIEHLDDLLRRSLRKDLSSEQWLLLN
jgi:hypothetical protein